MSVAGSIDTVGLLDLLNLLGTTRKTGRLQVSADRVSGHVWLLDGDLIGSQVGRARTDLDAVFQLLRVTSGEFNFDTNVAIPIPNHRVPLLGLLDGALSRLAEWREIELVVPSLDSVVRLMPELRGSEAMVGADQWRVIAAIGHASGVVDILDSVDLEEFEGCRVIKELVDIGFVRVDAPDERAEEPRAALEEEEVAPPEMSGSPASDVPAEPDPQPAVSPTRVPVPRPGPDFEQDAGESHDQIHDQITVPVASDVPTIPAPVSPQIGAEVGPSTLPTDSELDQPLSRGTLLKFLSSMRT